MTGARASELGPSAAATGSDVGSLYPFIESQAVKGEFPLSFLNPKLRSLRAWKRRARGKLLDLLDYAPPKCPHRPRGTSFLPAVEPEASDQAAPATKVRSLAGEYDFLLNRLCG